MQASPTMYDTYADLYKQYIPQFGPKTTIFLQVGSFYELYDTQNTETGECALNIREITDYLGLQIAIHKGDAPNKRDGLVAGFPEYALHKWAGRLTSAGWTVVVVDQIKTSTGKVQRRTLARVLSPSTHVENISATDTPYLTTIYFVATSESAAPKFGVASLDLTTGLTITYSDQATGRADIWTTDTLVQNLSIFQPKEVLIYWNSPSQPAPSNLRTLLGLQETTTMHIRQVESIGSFSKPLANAEYLRQSYSIKSLLPPREYLGIRSTTEELALLYLLQFIEEHMPSVSHKLAHNEAWVPNQQLVCGNHALAQLQITSAVPNAPSVAGLFTGAITPMGKRGLIQRLGRPLTSAEHIEARLAQVDEVIGWESATHAEIQRQLRFCFDLPRLHRKLLTGTLQLTEYAPLYQTYTAIQAIAALLTKQESRIAPTYSTDAWNAFFTIFQTHIDSKKIFTQSAIDLTPFSLSTYPAIADLEKQIKDCITAMECDAHKIAFAAGLAVDSLRLEARDKGEAYGIRATGSQIKVLQARSQSLPRDTRISVLKSGGWVETPTLITLNHALFAKREQLMREAQSVHMDVCAKLTEAGGILWTILETWITHLDVTHAIAHTCTVRGFHRPTIVQGSSSYVHIEGLRHPLVEASATRIPYVQHTVSLGKSADAQGYLIYGMNASGKSTLMKATGVAVLLAQAGCYVPASNMELSPFRAIYTRILNHDNLFAGLSSFAVEMSELRDILGAADHQTLVLGDELCAGTESVSAEALVAAGIQWLSKQSAKFMFATHLHRLSELLQEDMDTLGLKVYHLHVDYDHATKRLVYDRSLRPGSGTSLYGLEVARAMDLPLDFIEQAHANRRALLNTRTQSEASSSTWNHELVRRSCEICSASIGLEVHHIEPQAIANRDGILPSGKPINTISNLIVLCEACHDKHHNGKLQIQPLIQTSDGPQRIDSNHQPTPPTHSKWSGDDLQKINAMLKQYRTTSLKLVQFQLKQLHAIDISTQTLGKMRREC